MANRRMFSKEVIDSDAFLDMPLSTQCLYFHLSMRADDDGFVNNPKKIARMVGSSDDDAKLLIAKSFILTFESGVIVIKHWKLHNYIQKDRYKPSTYTEEREQLHLKDNGAYTIDTSCIHIGDSGKVSIGKERKEKGKNNNSSDLLPKDIIIYYKENISSKNEKIKETKALNAMFLKKDEIDKILKGLQNYSIVAKDEKEQYRKNLFEFIDGKIYLDYQELKIADKRVFIVNANYVGVEFNIGSNRCHFTEKGYKYDDGTEIINYDDVQEAVNAYRDYLKESNTIQKLRSL